MADFEHGLGAIPSPPDERDWSIDALYAMTGRDAVAIPATYLVPAPYPPVLNQGTTPMCVAYSAAGEQGYYDLRDQGSFNYDEPTFFRAIGGDANGAVVRDAFKYRLATGYPAIGSPATSHRITAYYAVPLTQSDIQQAILAFGPVIVGTPWYQSWFRPVAGVLPAPDTVVGGHALQAVGWDSRGLRLRNSWGSGWGLGGDAFLPWAYLGRIREVWKAVDKIDPAPPTTTYSVHIAAGAKVLTAILGTSGCISGWNTRTWGPTPSSAPCKAPVIRAGCSHGSATVVAVTKGTFAGKLVRIGTGVTVVKSP